MKIEVRSQDNFALKKQTRTFSLLTVLVLQSGVQTCAPAAFASDDAANAALVELIRHSNVVNPDCKLQVAVSGEEALITTQRKSKSTDADCKIQSVLIAKTVFDSVPDGVQRVKLLLLDYEANDYSSIVVKRAEVKLFGNGGLTQKELLASLELTKSEAANKPATTAVVAGPGETCRSMLIDRIEKLKSKGANVSGYMAYFKQIEEAAKANDADSVKTKTDYLAGKLSDQEATIKQIRAAATTSTTSVSSVAIPKIAVSFAAPNVADIARRFQSGQLNSSEMSKVGLALRQYEMSDRLTRLNSQGINASKAIALCGYAQNLIYNDKLVEAQALLNKIDRAYPQ